MRGTKDLVSDSIVSLETNALWIERDNGILFLFCRHFLEHSHRHE